MKQRGRFERRHRLPRLHGGKLALLIACLIQTALSIVCFVLLGHVRGMLVTQSAADVWRGDGEDRFAQVSAFMPVTETKTLDDIRSFRATLENEFVQNSMEAPEGGSLYTDAYSGRTSLSVSGKSPGSVTVTAVGAGGNYFLFHPLTLLSGGYISDEDYMADRVVLDAQTAFNLFGSSDVAGMEVTINGRNFPIAGVVQSEADFATNAALAAGKFDLYYGEVKLTADWDLRSLLATGGALNYGGYSDAALDSLLAACRISPQALVEMFRPPEYEYEDDEERERYEAPVQLPNVHEAAAAHAQRREERPCDRRRAVGQFIYEDIGHRYARGYGHDEQADYARIHRARNVYYAPRGGHGGYGQPPIAPYRAGKGQQRRHYYKANRENIRQCHSPEAQAQGDQHGFYVQRLQRSHFSLYR